MASGLTVRGVHLELHPQGDYVSDVIRATCDFYEAAILDEIRRRVCGGTLVDVGAHIGNHAAFLSRFVPHAQLHAFEPVPANIALLRRNAPDAVIHPIVLGAHAGAALLTVEANIGHSHVDDRGQLRAPMRTLDSFGLRDVTLLKIDVEGYEPQVLAGAAETIARYRPLIVIEDWTGELAIPGHERAVSWEQAHQTFLFAPA